MSGAQTTAARDAEPSQPAASAIDALVGPCWTGSSAIP